MLPGDSGLGAKSQAGARKMPIGAGLLQGDQHYDLSLLNQGLTAQNSGDLAAAIDCYRAALLNGVKSFDLYFNLGLCLKKENQIDSAIESFDAASRLLPQHRPTLLHLTSLLIEKGNQEKSMEYWSRYEQAGKSPS